MVLKNEIVLLKAYLQKLRVYNFLFLSIIF